MNPTIEAQINAIASLVAAHEHARLIARPAIRRKATDMAGELGDATLIPKSWDERKALYDADYTQEERMQLLKEGKAMPPNGAYPIGDGDRGAEDLRRAIHAVGRGNAPHARIKAHIIKQAKRLGKTAMLPEGWA